MKAGIFVKNGKLAEDGRLKEIEKSLSEASVELYHLDEGHCPEPGTDVVLSVGGDGTFLSAAECVGDSGVPVLGVNLGRIGFLSENRPEGVAQALIDGSFVIEDRSLLRADVEGGIDVWQYALNEISIHRVGPAVLGISVSIDGENLPRYWADGLLVATASGSTAYSLSVGGPICRPDAEVLIISPVAPHNLNVRPLVVPDSCRISITVESRDSRVMMGIDNRNAELSAGSKLEVSLAHFSLKRIRLGKSDFVGALTSKLFWGEDIRNNGI